METTTPWSKKVIYKGWGHEQRQCIQSGVWTCSSLLYVLISFLCVVIHFLPQAVEEELGQTSCNVTHRHLFPVTLHLLETGGTRPDHAHHSSQTNLEMNPFSLASSAETLS